MAATEFAISAFVPYATTCGQAISTNDAARGIRHTRSNCVLCGECRSSMGRSSFQGRARNIPRVHAVHDPNHLMQTTVFDPKIPLREEARFQPDQYMAIISENGAKGELDTSHWDRRIVSEGNNYHVGESRDLWFMSYYLQTNRGGRGQMRVKLLSRFR